MEDQKQALCIQIKQLTKKGRKIMKNIKILIVWAIVCLWVFSQSQVRAYSEANGKVGQSDVIPLKFLQI